MAAAAATTTVQLGPPLGPFSSSAPPDKIPSSPSTGAARAAARTTAAHLLLPAAGAQQEVVCKGYAAVERPQWRRRSGTVAVVLNADGASFRLLQPLLLPVVELALLLRSTSPSTSALNGRSTGRRSLYWCALLSLFRDAQLEDCGIDKDVRQGK